MKTILRHFLIIALFSIAVNATAQTTGRCVYVEIRGLSQQRGVPELKKHLESISAIDSVTYCDNVGLAIIFTNGTNASVKYDITRLLRQHNYIFTIKSSIPLEEAMKICTKNSHQ